MGRSCTFLTKADLGKEGEWGAVAIGKGAPGVQGTWPQLSSCDKKWFLETFTYSPDVYRASLCRAQDIAV